MIVTHKLTLDLIRWGVKPRVDVSQDDRYSRNLEILLLANGLTFTPPGECRVLIRYKKPDGTGGSYDTLPDGTRAWSITGNVLTLALAPQVCTVPGGVSMVVSMTAGSSELSSFEIQLDVHPLPGDVAPSQEYVNVTGFVPQPVTAEVGQYLQVAAVDRFGHVTVVGTGEGCVSTLEITGADMLDNGAEPYAEEEAGSTVWARKYRLGIPRGEKGDPGEQGDAPVRGVDYWTGSDQEAIIAEVDGHIAQALADRSQLTPSFADSVEDCADTAALYVLPDGYLYAYLPKISPSYTNQVTAAQDFGSEDILNAVGYMDGYYASTSSPYYGSDSACVLTGWIPHACSKSVTPPTLYIQGAAIDTSNNHCRIQFSLDKTTINGCQSSTIANYYTIEELDTEYYRLTPVIRDEDGYSQIAYDFWKSSDPSDGYIRFSLIGTGANLVITFDEEISESAGTSVAYSWENTGHAFVPADYEDRILELESAAEKLEAQVKASQADYVPSYVTAEAEKVIDRVIAAQGTNTYVLAAISDLHYGHGEYTEGIVHACKALKYIDSRIKLDAVAVLGDYTDGYPSTGYADAIGDFKAVNSVLSDLRFSPNMRFQGNHDYYADAPQIIHRYIQAHNEDVVWGDKAGGYCCRDLEDLRLRIICVNTAEQSSGNIKCTAKQYQWFADSLDLSGKDDPAQWQILILSHHPLDWYTTDNYLFGRILTAYQNGANYTDSDIHCDFAEKNMAKVIGNIHGHIHNFVVDKLYDKNPNDSSASQLDIYRIATPEACYGRANEYSDSVWYEETSYPKTKGSAENTSFCIYCIDLDSQTIQAICYGAGYDRTISYGA